MYLRCASRGLTIVKQSRPCDFPSPLDNTNVPYNEEFQVDKARSLGSDERRSASGESIAD